jgi:hypothetical protein
MPEGISKSYRDYNVVMSTKEKETKGETEEAADV